MKLCHLEEMREEGSGRGECGWGGGGVKGRMGRGMKVVGEGAADSSAARHVQAAVEEAELRQAGPARQDALDSDLWVSAGTR